MLIESQRSQIRRTHVSDFTGEVGIHFYVTKGFESVCEWEHNAQFGVFLSELYELLQFTSGTASVQRPGGTLSTHVSVCIDRAATSISV